MRSAALSCSGLLPGMALLVQTRRPRGAGDTVAGGEPQGESGEVIQPGQDLGEPGPCSPPACQPPGTGGTGATRAFLRGGGVAQGCAAVFLRTRGRGGE